MVSHLMWVQAKERIQVFWLPQHVLALDKIYGEKPKVREQLDLLVKQQLATKHCDRGNFYLLCGLLWIWLQLGFQVTPVS